MAEEPKRKILLVGWDAADWALLEPLLAEGKLPGLARLIERGASGKIATLQPVLSPMLWNSVATGKRPDRHGIYSFVEPRPDGSGIRPVTSTSRTCKAIWNILSQSGLRSIVVNWFASFPAERIQGAVITDRYAMQSQLPAAKRCVGPAMVHPGELIKPLAELIVDPEKLDAGTILSFIPEGKDVDQQKDDRVRKLAKLIAKMSTIHAAACRAMLSQPWDFMAVYYDAIDHFGHTFMPYHPPAMDGIDPKDAEVYGPCVTACYQFQDMMLEAMLDYAGEETTVLLVSDHGFHSADERPGVDGYQDPVSWHRRYGVVVATGPGIRRGERISAASLLDVTPTILTLLGLPIGDDMDGRPWLEIFDQPLGVQRIETWETVAGDSGMHPEEAREDPVAAAEAIKQLVDLGYVEPPGEDAEKRVANAIQQMKCNQAVALTYSRRREQAVALWQELIDQADNDEVRSGYKMQLAVCLMRLGRLDEVEKLLFSLGPRGVMTIAVQSMLATIRLQQDRGEEALRILQSIATKTPTATSAFSAQLGLAYLKTHEFDKAHEQFDRALAGDEDNVVACFGMAELANLRGQHSDAVEHALRAIELADAAPAGHFQLGFALAKLGLVDEALLALSAFRQLSPESQKGRELYERLAASRDSETNQTIGQPQATPLPESAAQRVRRYSQGE